MEQVKIEPAEMKQMKMKFKEKINSVFSIFQNVQTFPLFPTQSY